MGVVSSFKTFHVLAFLILIRLASVFLVQTWYVPDEYWQSLEVAHKLVFGYGHLTWEWTKGIRSYVHPSIIACLYTLLEFCSIDHPDLLVILPRVLQALLSAWADYALYVWSGKHKWALFLTSVQWFSFYVGSRTLINSAEAAIITIALARFPFNPGHPKDNGWLCLAMMSCMVRPTALIVWLPLFLFHLVTLQERRWRTVALYYVPISLSMLALSTFIDSYYHGQLIFTPWEFLKMNVFNEIGSFYGSQPWYWYFLIGFPSVMGVNLLPFLVASAEAVKSRLDGTQRTQRLLLLVIGFTLCIYSFLPHKEFRFLLPLVSMATFMSQDTISRWSRKAKMLYVYLVFGLLLIGNLVPMGYLGLVHQRGVLDAMPILREIAQRHPSNTSLLFLMPCHSTPLYSHLHVNVPVRFLTCEPNLTGKADYKDEAEQFFEQPEKWFHREYLGQQVGETGKRSKLPSHIILFDQLAPRIGNILSYYNPLHTLFHTELPLEDRLGKTLLIHERASTVQAQPKPAAPVKPSPQS